MVITDDEIYDKINNSIYWYDCQECDFQTDDHLQAYFHKAKTSHITRIRSASLKHIDLLLR